MTACHQAIVTSIASGNYSWTFFLLKNIEHHIRHTSIEGISSNLDYQAHQRPNTWTFILMHKHCQTFHWSILNCYFGDYHPLLLHYIVSKTRKVLQQHPRLFEHHKNYCGECDAMLLLQDLMRAMTGHIVTTWNRPLVSPTDHHCVYSTWKVVNPRSTWPSQGSVSCVYNAPT